MTDKKDEALKLALEALERYSGIDQRACDAEDAIHSALAEQPEQEQEVDWEKLYRLEVKKKEALAAKYERDTGKKLTRIVPMAEQPAQQQAPVAWVLEWTFNGEERGRRLYDDETHCVFDAENDGGVCRPLVYGDTSPPASKPWRGLTLEDKQRVLDGNFGGSRADCMDEAEKILRERNA